LQYYVVDANSVNSFKIRLDKFGSTKQMHADLTVIKFDMGIEMLSSPAH